MLILSEIVVKPQCYYLKPDNNSPIHFERQIKKGQIKKLDTDIQKLTLDEWADQETQTELQELILDAIRSTLENFNTSMYSTIIQSALGVFTSAGGLNSGEPSGINSASCAGSSNGSSNIYVCLILLSQIHEKILLIAQSIRHPADMYMNII